MTKILNKPLKEAQRGERAEAYRQVAKSTIRASKEETRDAESALLHELKARVGEAEQVAGRPATLRQLFEFYAADMQALGRAGRASAASPAKASTINRDLQTLRAAMKKARPEYRFPGGAFFKEDGTRVRWLRPEEEILVLETMSSPFREIAKLAALTLMRMSEIRTLRNGRRSE